MQFILATLTYLIMGLILALGILAAVKGSLWLLAVGFVGYILLFSLFGCLPPKSDHH